jgi:hypothetical protein
MRRIPSYLICLTLGAVIVAAPSLTNIGSDTIYDSALAQKGGNGKGNSGNKGGNKSASASVAASGSATNSSKQKSKDKQLALTDPLAPAHPSMLGRWNAAKPIDHPAIQAHIRNGKFNGTIGMVAAYAQAQAGYNDLEAQAAAAEAAAIALEAELAGAGYLTVEEYEAAVLAETQERIDTLDQAIAAAETAPLAPAEADMTAAFDDLAAAEANMEAYSNRAPWGEIRDDVRAKMGLDPAENDLVTEAPVDPTAPLTP